MNHSGTPHRSDRAFTLIELIVVIVILAVMAGLVVPRFMSNDLRRAQAEVRALAGMLSLVAQRDALGNHQMALSYEALHSSVRLDTRRRSGPTDRKSGSSTDSPWRPDPLLSEVDLSACEVIETRFDGKPADDRNWRIEFAPGGSGVPRPLIEIVVAQRGGKRDRKAAWLIELIPSAPEASIVTADPRTGAAVGRAQASIDLDRLGRSDVAW